MNVDEQLRQALLAETPDASGVVAAVRARIQNETRRAAHYRWFSLVAASLLAVGGTAMFMKRSSPPQVFSAAVRDHRVEVVEHGPRRWNLALQTMQPLLDQYKVGWSDLQALLPVGLVLERAKQCRIDGQPTLHLVFSDGVRKLSVYIRQGADEMAVAQTSLDDSEVASFHRGRISGIVVAAGAPGLCAEAVRRLASL